MKMHIIGGSGSGKTYISNILKEKLDIDSYDLDKIQWNQNAKNYGAKNSPEIKEKLLNDATSKKDWIIEGVYYKWCDTSFEKADYIFFISVSLNIQRKRIIKRFIKRKLKIEKTGKKESLKSLYDLLKWNKEYNTKDQIEIMKKLEPYSKKLYKVKGIDEILEILNIN